MASNETRFLTAGGATITLTPVGIARAEWTCTGCGARCTPTADLSAHKRANDHANRCRVMPRG